MACIGADELEDFETRHGVRLPTQYRAFITRVGNGGAGPPHYGLVELSDTPGLSQPFTKRARVHGRLYLGTDGCGIDYVLVVSGKPRGQVWMHTDGALIAPRPPLDFLAWYERWLDGELEAHFGG